MSDLQHQITKLSCISMCSRMLYNTLDVTNKSVKTCRELLPNMFCEPITLLTKMLKPSWFVFCTIHYFVFAVYIFNEIALDIAELLLSLECLSVIDFRYFRDFRDLLGGDVICSFPC